MENIPAGYEPVSLIEALNGPRARPAPVVQPAPAIASPDTDTASQVLFIMIYLKFSVLVFIMFSCLLPIVKQTTNPAWICFFFHNKIQYLIHLQY